MTDYKYPFRSVGAVNNPCIETRKVEMRWGDWLSGKANKCHGVPQTQCLQLDAYSRRTQALIPSLEEGDGLKLQAENKQQAGNPSESKAEILLCATASPHPQPEILVMWVQEHSPVTAPPCNATQGPLCQPVVAALLWACSLQSHPMKRDGLSEIYFASLEQMISAPSKSDSSNHHQLLLLLHRDSVSDFLLQRPLKSALF